MGKKSSINLMNILKACFPKEDFLYSYKSPESFYLPQWQLSEQMDMFYLIYRLFNSGYFYMILYFTERATWHIPHSIKIYIFLYYTYWSFLISSLTSALYLIICSKRFYEEIKYEQQEINHHQEDEEIPVTDIPILYKIQYALSALTFDTTLTTSFGFWTLVYFYQHETFHFGSCILHLWNTVIVLIDFMIIRVPASLAHVVYSITLTVLYLMFTFVYYLGGGKSFTGTHYLYKMLDYEKPGLVSVGLIAILAYLLISRLLAFGLYNLRRAIFKKFFNNNDQ